MTRCCAKASREEQISKTDFKIYKPVGCSQCTDGYKGRVGIYEVLPVTEAIGRIILEGGSAPQIRDAGPQGRRLGFAHGGPQEGPGRP